MNDAKRKELAKVILATSIYYGRQITQEVISLMLDDLSDLEHGAVMQAYATYRRNPKNRQMPLPAQIREMIEPQNVDAESAAREIAARISAAIPKFGWCNGNDARQYIGEIGWSVVQRQGGWTYLCEHHGRNIDPTTFQAQVRELAKSTINHEPNRMAQAIGLSSSRSTELVAASEIFKLMEGEGNESDAC